MKNPFQELRIFPDPFHALGLNLYIVAAALVVTLAISGCSGESNSHQNGGDPHAALIQAVQAGDIRAVEHALNQGASGNHVIQYKGSTLTPLLLAAALGQSAIYDLLVEKGARPDVSFKGYTAQEIRAYTLYPDTTGGFK